MDRLVDEENSLGLICDRLRDDLRWLESYRSTLSRFNQALLACLDADPPAELHGLNALQRAYLFQSFFDDHFLNGTRCFQTLDLRETYTSPLGKTVHRDSLRSGPKAEPDNECPDNMDFNSIVIDRSSPIELPHLHGING